MTTGDFPPGSGPPEVSAENRLAWVLTYGGSPADYRGPVGFTPPLAPVICDDLLILDARSGTRIVSAQICPGAS